MPIAKLRKLEESRVLGAGTANAFALRTNPRNVDPQGHASASPATILERHTRLWMAAAFLATLGLSVAAAAIFHAPHKTLGIALATSARVAFAFFWPAYVGGALHSLFGDVFSPLRKYGRELGLAFAAAILVHLGFVACLYAFGNPPPVKTVIVFGSAAILTLGLALLSIDRVRRTMPASFWPLFRNIAMNYILLAFLLDFIRIPSADFRSLVLYVPFAALAIIGPVLRLVAWMLKSTHALALRADRIG